MRISIAKSLLITKLNFIYFVLNLLPTLGHVLYVFSL